MFINQGGERVVKKKKKKKEKKHEDENRTKSPGAPPPDRRTGERMEEGRGERALASVGEQVEEFLC